MNDLKSLRLSCWISLLILVVSMVAAAPVQAFAAYDVAISGASSASGSWSGGSPDVWTPSGTGSNVSAADIQSRLATAPVSITTGAAGAEAGDISVLAALSWSANALTLSAANNVHIDAVMTATDTSALTMTTGTGTVKVGFAQGECNGFAGRVDFFLADGSTPRAGSGFLTINGAGYTVITSLGAAGSTTGTDLQGISGSGKLSGKYALGANIDASPTSSWNFDSGSSSYLGFLPLGNSSTNFTGVFDGLGHTVSGLSIVRPSAWYVGLFGYISSATLRNVGVRSAYVEGSYFVGGVAGEVLYGAIHNAYVDNPSQADGQTRGWGNNVGGLAGQNAGGGSWIGDVYSRTIVTMDSACYVGGLVGYNSGTISNAYYVGDAIQIVINGSLQIGGLVGYNAGTVSNAYARNVKLLNSGGCSIVGGLVGMNDGTIGNSYVGPGGSLSVFGGYSAGGLVGENYGSIGNTYAAGPLVNGGISGADIGGLVGYNEGGVGNSFWDIDATGRTTSAGGTGLHAAQMVLLATYGATWDIEDAGGTGKTWRIYDTHTYPLLRSFLRPLAVTANDDTRVYTGTPYSGGNGVTYLPPSYNPGYVGGTVGYGGSSQGVVAAGTYAITPGGLWSNQPGYDIRFVSGTLTILAAVVGRVPDGASGTPFTVSKSGSQLDLTWGASCGAAATDFAVYEGTIGSWYSHSSLVCSTSNATSIAVTPSSGNRYYLVVPLSASKEGSYGTGTGGAEIPQGSSPCKASQDLSACP